MNDPPVSIGVFNVFDFSGQVKYRLQIRMEQSCAHTHTQARAYNTHTTHITHIHSYTPHTHHTHTTHIRSYTRTHTHQRTQTQ